MRDESDLTKLARWIVPGWTAILSFSIFIAVDVLFSPPGQSCLLPPVKRFLATTSDIHAALTAIFIAAAGVPLGFSVYQAYFFFRWNSPFSRDGLLPPLISGRMRELGRITRDIQLDEMTFKTGWREEWVRHPLFTRDHSFRWRYIELLFTEAAQMLDSASEGTTVYGRHRYLHEIVHTLGASIAAVYIGFVGFIFARFYGNMSSLPVYLIASVSLVFLLTYFLHRETNAREALEMHDHVSTPITNDPIPAIELKFRVCRGASRTVGLSIVFPSSLFVFALALVHLFANPTLNPSPSIVDSLLRLSIAMVAVMAWTKCKKEASKAVKLGNYFSLGLSLALAMATRLVPSYLLSWIDWPFFTVILVFLVSNLVLLHNRRNANDDMLALEYYTLKRYLTER